MASALNILIIEDDEFQRHIISRILEAIGVAMVSHAGNGKEALEIIRGANSKPIEVAICDLNMPEMDGMEFLRHLGEGNHNISVILTSALDGKLLSSVGRMTKLYGINLLGIIEKPIQLSDLESILAKHDNSSFLREGLNQNCYSLKEITEGVESDQFEPYFQAKVDLVSGRLVGAEALARWLHPEHGVVSPGAFIPALEEARDIDRLTFRILEKTAAACRAFHEQGHILAISVNLSLTSLDDTSLADRITELVKKTGIDPQYLILEITESAAMTNVAPALENLARLCMNGFSLSIDDYGTGASNLQQLTRIAFSELKIDQSFVKDFTENKALMVVVKSSIDMARKLNVKSVAEGVETKQDCEALKKAGCDTAQGYYIAKPMDRQAFSEFMANYRPELLLPEVTGTVLPSQRSAKILVVDDDNFARKIILQVLRDLGYVDVIDTESAESAIKLFDSIQFDLVVTDVNMPGMNGLKFIQMIRSGKTRAKPGTRIMVLTLFSQTEVLSTALALDVNGILVKPIIPSVAEAKLACAMSERLHLRPPIAYESVRTEAKSLPREAVRALSGAAVVLKDKKVQAQNWKGRTISLNKVQPGMILAESVYLNDGMLILSAGHALSEVSINRLIDLEEILATEGIVIQERVAPNG